MENSPESSSHKPVDAAKLEDRKGTGSTWPWRGDTSKDRVGQGQCHTCLTPRRSALSHVGRHCWQTHDRVLNFIRTASPPEMQMAKIN